MNIQKLLLTATVLLGFQTVGSTQNIDLSVKGKSPYPYYSIPVRHTDKAVFSATVENNGDNVNGSYSVKVTDDFEAVQFTKTQPGPIFNGTSDNVNFEPITLNKKGLHQIKYEVSADDDQNKENDTSTVSLNITNNFFCYNDFDTAKVDGIFTDGNKYVYFGHSFEVTKADSIMSLITMIADGNKNDLVYGRMYRMDSVGVYSHRFVTEAVIPTGLFHYETIQLGLVEPYPVYPGKYVVCVGYLSAGQYNNIVKSKSNYTPGTVFYATTNASPRPYDTIAENQVSVYLKVVTKGGLISNIEQNALEEFDVFPNPVSDFLTVETHHMAKLEILNSLGQSILKEEIESGNNKVNTTALIPGSYILRLQMGGHISSKILIKQ